MNELREAIWSEEAAIPLSGPFSMIRSIEESRAAARRDERFSAGLIGVFALVALGLATIGMYGVISYTAASTHVALVSGWRSVPRPQVSPLRLVRAVAGVAIAGLGVGALASVALSRLASGFLFGVEPVAWPVYAAVAGLVLFLAIGAGYVLASRAGRLDPLTVLRFE